MKQQSHRQKTGVAIPKSKLPLPSYRRQKHVGVVDAGEVRDGEAATEVAVQEDPLQGGETGLRILEIAKHAEGRPTEMSTGAKTSIEIKT
jgi:hypothetical protein